MKKTFLPGFVILISAAAVFCMLTACFSDAAMLWPAHRNSATTQGDSSLNGQPTASPTAKNDTNTHSTIFTSESTALRVTNVSYAGQSRFQRLDVHLPPGAEGPFPVLVEIHGSGGDKSDGLIDAQWAFRRGYAIVSINYRPMDVAPFPAAVYDVKAAVRFIRAEAGSYNLDPDKIVAWGFSFGGYLAAMLGTTAGVGSLEDPGMGHADHGSAVQAVVDWSGAANFDTLPADMRARGLTSTSQGLSILADLERFLGVKPGLNPEKARAASPVTYLSRNTVPFFIEHGEDDNWIPLRQSTDFAEALTKVIGADKVVYMPLANTGHGGPAFHTDANYRQIFAFLDRNLQ